MRPSQTFQVLEVLRNSYDGSLCRKGVTLSSDDSSTTLDVYQQWFALCVDLGYLPPDALLTVGRKLWLDIVRADVFSLNNAFAEGLHAIRIQSHKGFKALCSQISTHLYNLIRDDYVACLQSDVFAARRLVQLFSYTSRLSLKDIDLSQALLADYRLTEERILSEFDDQLIHHLNSIIKRWIGPYQPEEFSYSHGPGGVAGHGRCALSVKYKDLTYDALLSYAHDVSYQQKIVIRSSLDRISQTIFVPKSYKTFRTISMEPATLMFYQQGVWRAIDELVASSFYLRNHIGFHDQSRNKELARQGSFARNIATIDLSAASDSVSYALVKKLFRGTWLLRHVVSLRSTRSLLPDGSLIELKKFAPMGSALCFPIETIVFASICEYVTRKSGVPGQYSVYGDDIIVPAQCVEATISVLSALGFLTNREKSFSSPTCWFRESCGGEYCDGFDVTPMRVSRRYDASVDDVVAGRLIDMANTAYLKGFPVLRHVFLDKLRRTGFQPLFSPTALFGDNYTNYHLERRWNHALQRIEARASRLCTSVPCNNSSDEEIRYHHWFVSTYNRYSVGDGFQSVVSRSTTFVSESWQMKPFEGPEQPFIDYFTNRS